MPALLWDGAIMSRAYDGLEFTGRRSTPDAVARSEASEEMRAYVASLIGKEKTAGLTDDECSELDHFMQAEHIMRLVKALAKAAGS